MAFFFNVESASDLTEVFRAILLNLNETYVLRGILKPDKQLLIKPPDQLPGSLIFCKSFDGIISFRTGKRRLLLFPENILLSGNTAPCTLKNKTERTTMFLMVLIPCFEAKKRAELQKRLMSLYHCLSDEKKAQATSFVNVFKQSENNNEPGLVSGRSGDLPSVTGKWAENFADSYMESIQNQLDFVPVKNENTRVDVITRIFKAKEYIDFFYSSEISLKMISSAAMFCDNSLLLYYKRIFGISPLQYVICKRLQHAKALLKYTSLPLAIVVLKIGFQNPSSFSRLFRSKFGVSPSEYRKEPPGNIYIDGFQQPANVAKEWNEAC